MFEIIACLDLAEIGQIGDAISGIAGLGSLCLLGWVMTRTVPDAISKARAEHVVEARANAVKEAWTSCAGLFEALRIVRLPTPRYEGKNIREETERESPRDEFDRTQKPRLERLEFWSTNFMKALALSEIYLSQDVVLLMNEILQAKEEYLLHHAEYSVGLDNLALDPEERAARYERAFGTQPQKIFDDLKERARAVLHPLALPM